MTIRQSLGAIRRRFFSAPATIRTRKGMHRFPVRPANSCRVVGRGLCIFRCEDFSKIPRDRRRSALAFQVPIWSPFERTGYHCVWSGSKAMVWCWDEEALGRSLGDAEVDPDLPVLDGTVPVLPETVFLPRKTTGAALQRCHDGWEIQIWKDGVLLDSRWFSERPGKSDITRFHHSLRQAGSDESQLAAGLPEALANPLPAAHFPDPWIAPRSAREWLEDNEWGLVAACVFAVAAALVWQEARVWKFRQLTDLATGEYARVQDELDPILASRDDFVKLRRRNESLAELDREPSQAYLMKLVDDALPAEAAQLHNWDYQQKTLRFVIEEKSSTPDPIAYVRALEGVPEFARVKVEPARETDRLEITLEVEG